jgi:hypothetical protein
VSGKALRLCAGEALCRRLLSGPGSVSASPFLYPRGGRLQGNPAGGGGSASLTFATRVANPLPAGVTSIDNTFGRDQWRHGLLRKPRGRHLAHGSPAYPRAVRLAHHHLRRSRPGSEPSPSDLVAVHGRGVELPGSALGRSRDPQAGRSDAHPAQRDPHPDPDRRPGRDGPPRCPAIVDRRVPAPAMGPAPTTTFSTPGTKTVTLKTCNAAGCSTVSKSLTVLDPAPRIVSETVPVTVGTSSPPVIFAAPPARRPPLSFNCTLALAGGSSRSATGPSFTWAPEVVAPAAPGIRSAVYHHFRRRDWLHGLTRPCLRRPGAASPSSPRVAPPLCPVSHTP